MQSGVGHAGKAFAPTRCGCDPAAMREKAPRMAAGARATALIVASAMFMEQLDGTVLATALPSMARDFDTRPLNMNVALTAYLLTLAMFIPASGRIADRFGSRTVFRAAIGVFTAGSILCGVSSGLPFAGGGANAARRRAGR